MSADLVEIRRKALSKGVANLETVELVFLAKNLEPPMYPSDVINWADREAAPLLKELGERLETATARV